MCDIEELLQAREFARFKKDWVESDRLRDTLQQLGVVVVDTPQGQHNTTQITEIPYSAQARINQLTRNLAMMDAREAGYSRRIAVLVRENLKLKYGTQKEN